MGSTSLLRGTLAGNTGASATPSPAHFEVVINGQTSVKAGQTVRLSMPPAALHFFDEQGVRLQDLTS
jgi:ABC-type sugar transport system ATPase subunit